MKYTVLALALCIVALPSAYCMTPEPTKPHAPSPALTTVAAATAVARPSNSDKLNAQPKRPEKKAEKKEKKHTHKRDKTKGHEKKPASKEAVVKQRPAQVKPDTTSTPSAASSSTPVHHDYYASYHQNFGNQCHVSTPDTSSSHCHASTYDSGHCHASDFSSSGNY